MHAGIALAQRPDQIAPKVDERLGEAADDEHALATPGAGGARLWIEQLCRFHAERQRIGRWATSHNLEATARSLSELLILGLISAIWRSVSRQAIGLEAPARRILALAWHRASVKTGFQCESTPLDSARVSKASAAQAAGVRLAHW
jgi:hypothetical protein